MSKSFHTNVSPYASGAQSPIIDKNIRKWEPLLAILSVFAILLPAAAEANISGLVGLSFLGLRRWKDLRALDEERKSYLWSLLWGLGALWGTRIILGAIDVAESGISSLSLHMRLLGKQGFYGFFLIVSFCVWSMVRPKNRSMLRPKAVFFFSLSVLIYAIGQRYFGWDFVHGFDARLGANRFAYGVYRASAWMGHPLTLAYNALLFGTLCFVHARWLRKRADSEAPLWFGIALVCLGILALSQSRFPLLIALGLGTLAWLEDRRGRRLMLGGLLLAACLAALWLLSKTSFAGRWTELTDSSVSWEQRFDRLLFWKVHIRMFLGEIWTGVGLGGYETRLLDTYAQAGYTDLERKYNAHNIYLQTLADSGVIGGVGLCVMLGALGRLAIRVKKRFGHSGLVYVLLVTVIGGLAQNNLRDSEYLFALWTCIGLSLFWLSDQGKSDEPACRDQLQDRQS